MAKDKKGERTEEEKVSRAPIKVVLGGADFEIDILVIKDARVWREKVTKLITQLPELINTTMDDSEGFGKAFTQMMVVMPNQVLDLFFEYAKDLNREEIEGMAIEAEIAKAFEQIVAVTFPLAESLPKTVERLSQ